ncbi:GNAT family N-acetyltransferase [Algihabitans albus]|uniref:GNAT family N-acetyltransferase n=1 Tax=Algihabitans albus TaxID=2164067 RepID=UPI000E5CBEEF|nr:GNAT family N-acetyltransferase [Algihabitans albus]
MSEILCRPPVAADKDRWAELFRGYMTFYDVPPEEAVVERVWAWLFDPDHEIEGLVAELEGRIVGLAHYQPMARTLGANEVGYLSDLFTDPNVRGRGIGRALIDATLEASCHRGWPLLRWLTQEFNYAGRRLYDTYAPRSDFIVYVTKTAPETDPDSG